MGPWIWAVFLLGAGTADASRMQARPAAPRLSAGLRAAPLGPQAPRPSLLSHPALLSSPGISLKTLIPPSSRAGDAPLPSLPRVAIPYARQTPAINAAEVAQEQNVGSQSPIEAAKIEGARKFDGAATAEDSPAPVEDLPPAGSDTGMTTRRVAWLYRKFVLPSSPDAFFGDNRKLSYQWLASLAGGDQETLINSLASKEKYGILTTCLGLMHWSLGRVMNDATLEPRERISTALALSQAYAKTLEKILASPKVPVKLKTIANRSLEFLRPRPVLIEELAGKRQIEHRMDALSRELQESWALVRPQEKPVRQQAPQQRQGRVSPIFPWDLEQPIDKSERGQGGDGDQVVPVSSLAEMFDRDERDLRALSLPVRTFNKYRDLFSRSTADRAQRVFLTNGIQSLLMMIESFRSRIDRAIDVGLRKVFMGADKPPHEIFHVPNNPNLGLFSEPGGFLLEAHFQTDIQEDSVLDFIKRSIEDYWQGSFTLGGNIIKFRTRIHIEKLPLGGQFSSDSIRIIDGKNDISFDFAQAGREGDTLLMRLGRTLRYDIPAHEFGHILGLTDEYSEGFDIKQRAWYVSGNKGSLMGDFKGIVQPRHFKTAYLLLRRHCLRKPNQE